MIILSPFDVIDQQSQRKNKRGGVMILIPKIFQPKLRVDLNSFDQKFDSIWVELKTSKKKIERSTLLNISYNANKSKKYLLYQLTSDNPIIQILFLWVTTNSNF